MKRQKQVTLKQLAEHTNLSVAAVSLALIRNPNGTIRVSEETRQRVRKAAKDLGYRHNRAAQVLRKGKTNVIGILSFQAYNQIGARRLHEVVLAVAKTGMTPFVYHVDAVENACSHACEVMLDHQVDGVLLVTPEPQFTQTELNRLLHYQTPVALVGKPTFREVPRYVPDRKAGFEQIVGHLIDEGFRSIGLLCPQSRPDLNSSLHWSTDSVIDGFKEGVKRSRKRIKTSIHCLPPSLNGLEFSNPDEISPYYFQGYIGARALHESKRLPEALVCQNDQIATGAMRAFAEAGLKVPWDIAVTGFDNDPSSSVGIVPMTSVEHPLREMSERAVADLVGAIRSEKPLHHRLTRFPCRLVVRQSSIRRELPKPELLVDLNHLLLDE